MTLALTALAALVAAIIQRITGLGFVLALIGPVVLLHGAGEGTRIAVLLALVASTAAIPFVWRQIDWRRVAWLAIPGMALAPVGAWIVTLLDDGWLMILVAAMAFFALTAGKIRGLSHLFVGKKGALFAGGTAGFMHVTSGLSGPALAAYAVGDKWEQRSFSSSVQAIFVVLSAISVLLRGLPTSPAGDVVVAMVVTAIGIAIGTVLARYVPAHIARTAMLVVAWAGAVVVLVRGILALIA